MTTFSLRLPDGMTEKIDARATKGGFSRNAWIIEALKWALEQPPTTRTRKETI